MVKTTKSISKSIEISTRSAENLGQALKRFRNLAGYTQSELSQTANIRQGTVSKAEKGVSTTNLQTIYEICTALNLEVVIRPRASKNQQKKLNLEEIFK